MAVNKSVDEAMLIPGPAGDIELLVNLPEQQDERPVVLLCHPHPLHGGSLNNKVVHMLARAAADQGLGSVRFNFRGVGQSQGQFDHGRGELDDMLAVVEWLRGEHGDAPLWLAGFSFGSYIALKGHKRAEAERLLLVAPPVGMYDFAPFEQVDIPWWVFQGGADEVVDAAAVAQWVEQLPRQPRYEFFPETSHFFHGKLNLLREAAARVWSDQ